MTAVGTASQQAVIYLNFSDEQTLSRQRAILEQYLKDANISAESVAIRSGPNPNTSTLAAGGLRLPQRRGADHRV